MTGLALAYSDLPLDLIRSHNLDARVHDRGGEKEVQFMFHDPSPLLPVLLHGTLQLARWGTRRGESKSLPVSGWTWLESVESGKWAASSAVEVLIPARLGFDRGIWFSVKQGARGLVVEEAGVLVAYMIVEPASHYYEVMTRAKQMASLVGERI